MALPIGKVLMKVFGSRNERLLKRYHRIVDQINALEAKVRPMTDEQLRARTQELREGLTKRKLRTADVLPEAFAIVRESMDRHIGIRQIFNPDEHFDPDQLDDNMLELYDQVQQRMIARRRGGASASRSSVGCSLATRGSATVARGLLAAGGGSGIEARDDRLRDGNDGYDADRVGWPASGHSRDVRSTQAPGSTCRARPTDALLARGNGAANRGDGRRHHRSEREQAPE